MCSQCNLEDWQYTSRGLQVALEGKDSKEWVDCMIDVRSTRTAYPVTTIRILQSTGGKVLVQTLVHEVVHESQYSY